jgi:NAD+ diphosphatase
LRQQLLGVSGVAAPRQYAFQDGGLDRAEHLRDDLDALALLWPRARLMVVDGEGLACFEGEADSPSFLLAKDMPRIGQASFLGTEGDGGQPWFAVEAAALAELPASRLDLRNAALHWSAQAAAVFAQARALLHWQSRNRFCGACGEPLVLVHGGFAARCARCALEHYPRTDAAIIVAVSDGERLLLGRQASWPEKRYSVLAGFLEPGESLEQAVAREVMEEAGVRIDGCQYLASQPWPFPSSLMLGFRAEAAPQPVRIGAELQDARWFDAAQIRSQVAAGELQISPRLSISRWLIEDWLASR